MPDIKKIIAALIINKKLALMPLGYWSRRSLETGTIILDFVSPILINLGYSFK